MDANIISGREAKFERVTEEAAARWCASPLKWGRDDCLMALADIMLEVTGHDLAAEYRGRYSDRDAAAWLLGRRGAAGAVARAATALGWGPMTPAACRSGSLGVFRTPDGLAGVIRFRGVWAGRGADGVGFFPSEMIRKAWGW